MQALPKWRDSRECLLQGYNETLATNLTPLYKNNEVEPNIEVSFRVPKTIPGFGSDYQLEVWEAQIDPGDMSSRIVEFFRIAAPCE